MNTYTLRTNADTPQVTPTDIANNSGATTHDSILRVEQSGIRSVTLHHEDGEKMKYTLYVDDLPDNETIVSAYSYFIYSDNGNCYESEYVDIENADDLHYLDDTINRWTTGR